MWESGPSKLMWRWTPCLALVLGSVSFASFVTLAIPDHIGSVAQQRPEDTLYAAALARPDGPPAAPAKERSFSETTNTVAATPAPRSGTMAHSFPKRGFSPPLERVEAPKPPPQQPITVTQPQLSVVPQQQPSAPAGAEAAVAPASPSAPPPQADSVPQPVPAPVASAAEAPPAPPGSEQPGAR